ncbi:MAG TPA: proton-conducting transporter membrane subunit, partial [Planctomycetaceae bacterium]|nr:proton-conducting transporter membrane subunit [Planctomycetaceae bacterium]
MDSPVAHQVAVYRWFGDGAASPTLDVSLRVDALSLAAIGALALAMAGLAFHPASRDSATAARRRSFAEPGFALFAAAMLLASENLLQLFVFWELLSVAVWLAARADAGTKPAAQAGGRVLLTQFAGDALLLTAVLVCGTQLGTLSMAALSQQTGQFLAADVREPAFAQRTALVGLTGFLVAAAAVVRCGQFPAFGWLNDAARGLTAGRMNDAAARLDRGEAASRDGGGSRAASPTTRLALIQLVMPLGLYLVLRFEPLLVAAPDARWMLVVLGSLTAVMAASVAVCEHEPSQVLLFSLASQLGLMLAGAAHGTAAGVAGAVGLWLVLLTARTAFVLCIGDGNRGIGWVALALITSGLAGQHMVLAALWNQAVGG